MSILRRSEFGVLHVSHTYSSHVFMSEYTRQHPSRITPISTNFNTFTQTSCMCSCTYTCVQRTTHMHTLTCTHPHTPTHTYTHTQPLLTTCSHSSPILSAVSVELYYIFSTLWGRETYTLYGILMIVFLMLVIVAACTSVTLTYFQLSSEDYRWWWRSVVSAG